MPLLLHSYIVSFSLHFVAFVWYIMYMQHIPEYIRFLTYNYDSHGTGYMTPSHSIEGSFSELFM